mmetsp:Transcript_21740/g.64017  ORF Transcript_21740/g.64017 Transcript_21740/m.64017 type:complete len:373 (+) Transcript_21740:350-1468(+)
MILLRQDEDLVLEHLTRHDIRDIFFFNAPKPLSDGVGVHLYPSVCAVCCSHLEQYVPYAIAVVAGADVVVPNLPEVRHVHGTGYQGWIAHAPRSLVHAVPHDVPGPKVNLTYRSAHNIGAEQFIIIDELSQLPYEFGLVHLFPIDVAVLPFVIVLVPVPVLDLVGNLPPRHVLPAGEEGVPLPQQVGQRADAVGGEVVDVVEPVVVQDISVVRKVQDIDRPEQVRSKYGRVVRPGLGGIRPIPRGRHPPPQYLLHVRYQILALGPGQVDEPCGVVAVGNVRELEGGRRRDSVVQEAEESTLALDGANVRVDVHLEPGGAAAADDVAVPVSPRAGFGQLRRPTPGCSASVSETERRRRGRRGGVVIRGVVAHE